MTSQQVNKVVAARPNELFDFMDPQDGKRELTPTVFLDFHIHATVQQYAHHGMSTCTHVYTHRDTHTK